MELTMGKNKKTPKASMRYWRVRGLIIKARTARVAVRKYIRGNLDHDILVAELELDNPFGGGGSPQSIDKKYRKQILGYFGKNRSSYYLNGIKATQVDKRARKG
jgi:hypothetical protein